jgi:hypothetical protein
MRQLDSTFGSLYTACRSLANTNTTKVLTSIEDLIRHVIKIGIQSLEQALNLVTNKTQNQIAQVVNKMRTKAVNS